MTDLPGTPMPPPSSPGAGPASPSTPPVPGPMPPPGDAPRVPTSGIGDTSDSSMKDRASDATQAAKQASADVASTATDKAKDVAQEAKRQARDLAGEARDQLSGRIGEQQHNLISNVRSLAQELEAMARGEISPATSGGVAHELVSQAGDRARSVADWLDGREPGELLDELRSFARRRPGAFLFGAMLAGVVAGRLTRGVVATHTEDSSSSGQLRGAPMYRTEQTTPLVGYGVPPTGVSDPGLQPGGTMGEEYVVGAQREAFSESSAPGSRPYDGGQP